MKSSAVLGILVLMVVAVVVGLGLASCTRQPTAYELEKSAMSLEVARAMVPFNVAFRVLLGGVVLVTLGGVGFGVVRWLNYRVSTLYPNNAGLFPVREQQVAGARVFHDPNRAPTATTVYAHGVPRVTVQSPVAAGQAQAQLQVTGQAQATQALRAAVSGVASLPSGGPVSMDMFNQSRVARPLPEVKMLEMEPSHLQRLLAEVGED